MTVEIIDPEKLTKEQLQAKNDEIAAAISGILAPLFNRYQGHAEVVARNLSYTLGYFIAVTATDPQLALDEFSKIIRKTNWTRARLLHSGFKPEVIDGGGGKGSDQVLQGARRVKPG